MTKVCLVDPDKKTVQIIEHSESDLSNLYHSYCGGGVDHFTTTVGRRAICGFVYEYGLIEATKDTKYFDVIGYGQPLAGKGVLVAANRDNGETISWPWSLKQTKALISFPQVTLKGFDHHEGKQGDWFVISHRAVFEDKEEEGGE